MRSMSRRLRLIIATLLAGADAASVPASTGGVLGKNDADVWLIGHCAV
jgi:hypothetical protein